MELTATNSGKATALPAVLYWCETLTRELARHSHWWWPDPWFTNVNGTLYFVANDGTTGYELWKSDGTSAGTRLVRNINSGGNSSYPRYLTNVSGTLFFSADDGTKGHELWKSDGTPGGTVLVRDIRPASGGINFGSYPRHLANVNGTLFFAANDGTRGYELWKSDGTSTGTVLVKDIRPGLLWLLSL
jgi:ELWxxDGT repeat protein